MAPRPAPADDAGAPDAGFPPAPDSSDSSVPAATGPWCAEEFEALPGDVCLYTPPSATPATTLVIFLHGVVKAGTDWQYAQQRAAAKTRQETVGAIEHRFDLARGRETGEHELPRGRGIARCGGDRCLMAGGEPLGHRPGSVPHGESPALGQMGRHRRADGAEADEGDRRQGHFERYRYEE